MKRRFYKSKNKRYKRRKAPLTVRKTFLQKQRLNRDGNQRQGERTNPVRTKSPSTQVVSNSVTDPMDPNERTGHKQTLNLQTSVQIVQTFPNEPNAEIPDLKV